MGYPIKLNTQTVVELYKSGKIIVDIAKMFKCDPSAVKYHLNKAGVKTINRFEKFSNEKIETICSLYNKGLSYTEIKKITGYCSMSIWKALKKNGIDRRNAGFYAKGKPRIKRIKGVKIYKAGNNSYRFIYKPNDKERDRTGYVREHRFVMAKILGRDLHSNEVVHHINGNGLDNRPENLALLSRREHASEHAECRELVISKQQKHCSRCKEIKPTHEFCKSKRSPFFYSYCRKCANEYNKKNRRQVNLN